jgi:hypothetical protein
MLKLYPSLNLSDGAGSTVTAYADTVDPTIFYVMPNEPSIRIDPKTNKPVLNFIKYLMPVDRPDGSKGGGFLIFDSCFVLSNTTRTALQNQLDAMVKSKNLKDAQGNPLTAKISLPSFVKGTAALTLLDSGGALVTKIESAGKPSLLGSLICSFTAELSPEGAAVVQGALSGQGGVIQIAYDLSYAAALPPVTGNVWFDAVKFASFYQTINKSGGSWDSGDNTENETMREAFIQSDSGGVKFDFTGMDMTDPNVAKMQSDLTDWGFQQLNIAAQNVLGASGQTSSSSSSSAPASSTDASSNGSSGSSSGTSSGGVTGSNTGADLGSDRSDDGMKNVSRNESSLAVFNFNEYYEQDDSIIYETIQQGTLPNVPNFNNYVETINANDPFFAQIHATLMVNADYQKFLIQSVDLNCTYSKSTPPTVQGLHFSGPDDVLKFDSDTVGGDMSYGYSFKVNYVDENQPYASPVYTTQDLVTTIDVGTLGVLFVNITVSNVDFTKVPQVQVALKYPDPDPSGAAVSRQFSFDTNNRTASMAVVMLKTVDKQYQYQVTYVLADGTQVVKPWTSDNTRELFINNLFIPKTVSFLAEGDFTNEINNIFLKMTYADTTYNYQQAAEYQFSSANRSHDWTFLVIPGSNGTLSYSGVVTNTDNTTQDIPNTTTAASLVTFGPPNQKIVTVTPDPALLDFTKIKLAQIEFQYSDPANNLSLAQEIVLKPTGATPPTWTFYTKDPTKTAYTYTATYYLATTPPQVVKQAPVTSSDTDLILAGP